MVTGGFEAAGDAITSGVIARTVEPEHGEARSAVHANCLNCSTALHGKHCHECGQAGHVHRTLGAYGHDLLHGVFHFEGKIWRTLPMLAFKPGLLTRRYIHGERAKFVSPLALFLFGVFLMFAVVSSLAGEMHAPDIAEASSKSFTAAIVKINADKAAVDRQIAAMKAAKRDTAALEKQSRDLADVLEGMELGKTVRQQTRGITVSSTLEHAIPGITAGLEKLKSNPNLFLYKIQSSAYKYSWALIPLSVPFVWLLFFWKHEYKLYDHAIFVTYSITFMLFLVTILTILDYVGVGEPLVPLIAVLVPPLHMYRQIRGAYLTSRFGAIARTVVLSLFGMIVLILFVMLLLLLGVLG